jgi:integrase/recombinase XerD
MLGVCCSASSNAKVFFNWCVKEGLIESNPADSRFKAPKQVKKVKPAFTSEHLEKMLAVFDTSKPLGFRNYVILILLLDTGMRLSDIAGLQFQNVYETYIKVLGKGRKEREIGIHPETGKLLWKYVNQYRLPADDSVTTFFLTRTGTNSTISLVKSIIVEVQKKTGLEDIQLSPHVFRHTFAKMYLESGGDLFSLSREMGHSDVQITKIYLEDFGSAEARKDHTSHSPIASLNLKKQHGKKKK